MMKSINVLGEIYVSWMPTFSIYGILGLLAACTGIWILLRCLLGPSTPNGRWGVFILRGLALAILFLIFLGPVVVDEEGGEVRRPKMVYLVDGSQSMQLGGDKTRWQESLQFLDQAEQLAGSGNQGDIQAFRFGHRLEPLLAASTADHRALRSLSQRASQENGPPDGQQITPPEASDSRLGDALRQLLSQISAHSSAGIVLCSDGRVRGAEAVERLAEMCGEANVPIHVVPVGHSSGAGDIAIVSLVVPTKVGKYTENELQVFFRSFGFTGQRTVVRVLSRSALDGAAATTLASVPVTLSGGAQAATASFRVNDRPEDLEVVIDPIEGELTERNNRVQTAVEIDRTKVRVLYVEGEQSASPSSIFGQIFSMGGSDLAGVLNVRTALQEDDGIECVAFVSDGGLPRAVAMENNPTDVQFPRNRAELFAYDCIIFNDVGPSVLSAEQNEWMAQWIAGRGGGLIVTGGRSLDPRLWADSPLLSLLPVGIEEARPIGLRSASVQVIQANHPVWRLHLEKKLNDQLLAKLPPLLIRGSGYQAKSTAEILAAESEGGEAVLLGHRAGRGRVIVSTANLGGAALDELADGWGSQPERATAKLWRNLVYWATEGSSTGRRRLVASADKQFYRPGESISIVATAYDEAARQTRKYRLWGMLEPASLDDLSLYSPVLWPDNLVRESGEVGSHIAWGEELPLVPNPNSDGYQLELQLSEISGTVDGKMRVELTAYEGEETAAAYGHGTQVDSTSLAIQILSDPFEQQNPLPNHDLLKRLAAVSGGQVLSEPTQLAELLEGRQEIEGTPRREITPAWSRWWVWLGLVGLLSGEWFWRRITGLA